MPIEGSAMEVQLTETDQRLAAFRVRILDLGLRGAVISTEANFLYLTGLRFDALWTSSSRSLVLVVPATGSPTLIIPNFLRDEASETVEEVVVVGYDPPGERIDDQLLELVTRLSPGGLGMESGTESRSGLTLDTVAALRGTLEEDFTDVSEALWRMRMRKSPAEIANLATAAHAGSLAFETVFSEGVTGRTERELARELARRAIESGADRAPWVACTSGPGSYHRFVSAPRDRRIETGDMVWADIGLTSFGYWTDFCRAATAGEVGTERAELQAIIVDATNTGIGLCRPGVHASEVSREIRKRASELGVDLLGYGRLGHGIGLSSTEPPSIAEWDETVLEEGMVVTIEPAVTRSSGLYCAEQVVEVTAGEPRVLTTATSQLTPG